MTRLVLPTLQQSRESIRSLAIGCPTMLLVFLVVQKSWAFFFPFVRVSHAKTFYQVISHHSSSNITFLLALLPVSSSVRPSSRASFLRYVLAKILLLLLIL